MGKFLVLSIVIPTITGGNVVVPDFMHIVKHKNGEKDLNIVVEN